MRYELVNRYYGTKLISPSEQHKDAFIAACKKDPVDNKPVWAVSKELPDTAIPTREGELLQELKRLQEELDKATGAGSSTDLPNGSEPQQAPKKKAKKG